MHNDTYLPTDIEINGEVFYWDYIDCVLLGCDAVNSSWRL
jgi:hypothetical protein